MEQSEVVDRREDRRGTEHSLNIDSEDVYTYLLRYHLDVPLVRVVIPFLSRAPGISEGSSSLNVSRRVRHSNCDLIVKSLFEVVAGMRKVLGDSPNVEHFLHVKEGKLGSGIKENSTSFQGRTKTLASLSGCLLTAEVLPC